MDAELKNLRIDRTTRRSSGPSKWATRWIVAGVTVLVALGAWRALSAKLDAATVVETQRVQTISAASAPEGVVLNATGYIVAAHRIEVAAKVVGKVKWIGVDKGDHVREGERDGAVGGRRIPGPDGTGARPIGQLAGEAG